MRQRKRPEGVRREVDKEALESLRNSYLDGLCEHIKYVKLHYKGYWLDNDDGLLWHFTHFSVLQRMLAGRQVWLSDLVFSNDTNELVYGLSRCVAVVEKVSRTWNQHASAEAVHRIASRAVRRWTTFHVYGFCLSEHRDTAQHWNAYGGGLHTVPKAQDPYVAIGFDAQALFQPLEITAVTSLCTSLTWNAVTL